MTNEERYTVRDLMRDLRSGPYTSVGSYPTYFLASDGEALSHKAVRANLWQVARATRDGDRGGWAIVGCDVNWENPDMYCGHTGERIESAYADPETVPEPFAVVPAKPAYLEVP